MGKISKVIPQDICTTLRIVLNINQWHSAEDCIKRFKDYDKNVKFSFIKYDIKENYPSITEKTVDEDLNPAKEHMSIIEDNINIIKHYRKSLLYHNDSLWITKGRKSLFRHANGFFYGSEICELIGYLLLHRFNNIIDPSNYGHYRDDWLIIVDKCTPWKCDVIRKKVQWLFNKFEFVRYSN